LINLEARPAFVLTVKEVALSAATHHVDSITAVS
jgi:hypothetical protein